MEIKCVEFYKYTQHRQYKKKKTKNNMDVT